MMTDICLIEIVHILFFFLVKAEDLSGCGVLYGDYTCSTEQVVQSWVFFKGMGMVSKPNLMNWTPEKVATRAVPVVAGSDPIAMLRRRRLGMRIAPNLPDAKRQRTPEIEDVSFFALRGTPQAHWKGSSAQHRIVA